MSATDDGHQHELQRQQALLLALDSGRLDGFAPGHAPHSLNPQVTAERGLQAYRGNAQALAARALAAVYPRLEQELGDSDFAAMAWSFWRRHPPRSGDLADWGEDVADYLAGQAEMDLALVDLARLEWACHEVERAADLATDLSSLARFMAQPERAWRARLAPGLRWLAPQHLVWRQAWRARWMDLSDQPATLDFMRRLLSDSTLAVALDACVAQHPDFDFGAWLQQALAEGWLLGLDEGQPAAPNLDEPT